MGFLTAPVVTLSNRSYTCWDGARFRAFSRVALTGELITGDTESHSTDGLNWTAGAAVRVAHQRIVASASNGAGATLVGFDDGAVYRSTAVGSWSPVTTLAAGFDSLYNGLTYSNGKWIAFAGAKVRTSNDGMTWSAEATISVNGTLVGAAYGASSYVLLTSAGDIFSSSDGVTWNQAFPIGGGNGYQGLVYDTVQGQFVASGSLMSTTVINSRTFPSGNITVTTTSYQPNLKVYTSAEGLGWTEHVIPIGAIYSSSTNSIVPLPVIYSSPTALADGVYLLIVSDSRYLIGKLVILKFE